MIYRAALRDQAVGPGIGFATFWKNMTSKTSVAIIGAGPAGLTAAYLLAKQGADVTVLEADPEYVGGISKTVKHDGFHFDIGGHRFFSKSKEVENFWTEILPNDMLERPRSSRIYYRNRFFAYPLKPFEALWNLGIIESILCVLSYLKARLHSRRNPASFEDWVINQFGERLFRIFFKTYTEKVWGMSCKDISADWAAQRIKGLSLMSAIKNAFGGMFGFGRRKPQPRDKVIKTLIDTFRYPRKGPGMMWEACAEKIKAMGGAVLMGQRADALLWNDGQWNLTCRASHDASVTTTITADHVISSAPIRDLVPAIQPAVSEKAREAARNLGYRDFLTVTLVLKGEKLFDDNWIYIHDPSVKVGRIQNFKSWSPEMVPHGSFGCYGLEYFCFEGDNLWSKSEDELIELAWAELRKIGLGSHSELVRGYVVRQPKAYPVYDEHYLGRVEIVRTEIERKFPTLHMVGRNGMHKYNNQDHAIMTAMLSVQNILAGKKLHDVWQVNQDAEYHESGLRSVPSRIRREPAEDSGEAAA